MCLGMVRQLGYHVVQASGKFGRSAMCMWMDSDDTLELPGPQRTHVALTDSIADRSAMILLPSAVLQLVSRHWH